MAIMENAHKKNNYDQAINKRAYHLEAPIFIFIINFRLLTFYNSTIPEVSENFSIVTRIEFTTGGKQLGENFLEDS